MTRLNTYICKDLVKTVFSRLFMSCAQENFNVSICLSNRIRLVTWNFATLSISSTCFKSDDELNRG